MRHRAFVINSVITCTGGRHTTMPETSSETVVYPLLCKLVLQLTAAYQIVVDCSADQTVVTNILFWLISVARKSSVTAVCLCQQVAAVRRHFEHWASIFHVVGDIGLLSDTKLPVVRCCVSYEVVSSVAYCNRLILLTLAGLYLISSFCWNIGRWDFFVIGSYWILFLLLTW